MQEHLTAVNATPAAELLVLLSAMLCQIIGCRQLPPKMGLGRAISGSVHLDAALELSASRTCVRVGQVHDAQEQGGQRLQQGMACSYM